MFSITNIILVVSIGINILLILLLLEQRRVITTDTLTGLLNKVGLDEKKNRRSGRRRNGGWMLFERRHKHVGGGAVLYLDLDKFKPINDKYGHHVGDLLIVEFSKFLARQIRTKDTLARLHGDEFVVVLEEVDEAEARKVADKIVENLEHHVFMVQGHPVKLEATVGVAIMKDGEDFDLDTLVKKADQAMLKAKKGERGER